MKKWGDKSLVGIEKAGEGNMNYTYRMMFSDGSSVIIKQAPPFCAKFPEISAPQQRIIFEANFYSLMANQTVRSSFPALLNIDKTSYIMVLEDLGKARDYTFLYANDLNEGNLHVNNDLTAVEASQLGQLLASINAIQPEKPIENSEMKVLNHAHIFDIPLHIDNGLNLDDITDGLDAAAKILKQDSGYKKRVEEIGNLYLQTGSALLHGDFYPGSWLQCDDGIKVIDPEFCFTGAIEFDLGVLLAHLVLSQQSDAVINAAMTSYLNTTKCDDTLAYMFAGTEIMRRLIGYAQLPIKTDLRIKAKWLEKSHQLLTKPSKSSLMS